MKRIIDNVKEARRPVVVWEDNFKVGDGIITLSWNKSNDDGSEFCMYELVYVNGSLRICRCDNETAATISQYYSTDVKDTLNVLRDTPEENVLAYHITHIQNVIRNFDDDDTTMIETILDEYIV